MAEWINTGLGALAVGMLVFVLKLLANHLNHRLKAISGDLRGVKAQIAAQTSWFGKRFDELPCKQVKGCTCKEDK